MKVRDIEAWADYIGREMQKRHGLPKDEARQIVIRGLRSIMKSTPPAGRVSTKRAKAKAAQLLQNAEIRATKGDPFPDCKTATGYTRIARSQGNP